MQNKHILTASINKNKEFLRALYTTNDLEDANKWFDKLDQSTLTREVDTNMTIDIFVDAMTKSTSINLKTNSALNQIVYCANNVNKKPESFAWVTCACTEQNYKILSNLIKSTYNQDIDVKSEIIRF